MKCTLPHDINKCPFFISESMECNNTNPCSFQEKEPPKEDAGYIREERWYEKYMRK